MKFEDYFYYDETSPTFLRWKVDRYSGRKRNVLKFKKGEVCGSFKRETRNDLPKCVDVVFFGKPYKVHRIIYQLLVGEIPQGWVIDHLDQNPWNNNINNLKAKPKEKNHRNMKRRSNNSSNFAGVSWQTMNNKRQTYAFAQIKVNPTRYYKRFAVHEYGLLPAFKMACEWYIEKRRELNDTLNAEFTELHGKELKHEC